VRSGVAPPETQAERIQEILGEEASAAFDFETGPLFRISLLRLNAHKHVLSLCLPSLCADSASLLMLIVR